MNWIMVKGLTVFVCGLALFGLAACGGGGGDDPPASDKPEMTIMPPPADHPNTLADAAPIMDGQTVTGVIDSPDDVDFFRLPVTEDSRVGFMLDAEAGLEIALLDSEGNALDIGETESVVRVGAVIVRGGEILRRGVAFARVTCGSSLVAARRCVKKSFKLLATAQTYKSSVEAVIEFLRGVPTLELQLGVVRVEQKIDLTRYVVAYLIGDRNPLPYTVTSIKVPAGLSMRVDGSKVATVAATPDVEPGKYRITAAIEVPGTEGVVKIDDADVRTAVRRILGIIINVRKRTSGNGQDPAPPPQDPTPPPQGPTTPPGSGVGLVQNGSCLAILGIGTCPTSGSEFESIFECNHGISGQFFYHNEATIPSFHRQVCERSGGTFIIHKGA